eukprot:scaffold262390_cov31-Tisochrysis_lutea.AAC.2
MENFAVLTSLNNRSRANADGKNRASRVVGPPADCKRRTRISPLAGGGHAPELGLRAVPFMVTWLPSAIEAHASEPPSKAPQSLNMRARIAAACRDEIGGSSSRYRWKDDIALAPLTWRQCCEHDRRLSTLRRKRKGRRTWIHCGAG